MAARGSKFVPVQSGLYNVAVVEEGESMWRVVSVEPISGYRLRVVFADGVQGEVDLSDRLFGLVFEPLRDLDLFQQADIDEFGAVCWPNGADLAPDALYETLAGAIR
jgi:hypothetical protein